MHAGQTKSNQKQPPQVVTTIKGATFHTPTTLRGKNRPAKDWHQTGKKTGNRDKPAKNRHNRQNKKAKELATAKTLQDQNDIN